MINLSLENNGTRENVELLSGSYESVDYTSEIYEITSNDFKNTEDIFDNYDESSSNMSKSAGSTWNDYSNCSIYEEIKEPVHEELERKETQICVADLSDEKSDNEEISSQESGNDEPAKKDFLIERQICRKNEERIYQNKIFKVSISST